MSVEMAQALGVTVAVGCIVFVVLVFADRMARIIRRVF
jgi:hypothetical protein